MSVWPVQDAKARFSEFLDTCVREGPQMVTRRGVDTAVLVPIDEWRCLQRSAPASLKQILLESAGLGEIDIPPRGRTRGRPIPHFD